MEELNPIPPIPNVSATDIPKPELEEKRDKINVWVKSLASLGLYLALGYFFFSHQWFFLLMITAIIVFHELGHFTAMKIFKYNDLGIFFIPLLGAYVSGSKQEVSQKQSAIILLAGPIPGILIGVFLLLFVPSTAVIYESNSLYADITAHKLAKALVVLNLLNLFPVYPLDGGQLLHRLFLDDFKIIGRIFVLLSAAVLVYFAIMLIPNNKVGVVLLIFPFFMITRMFSDIQHDRFITRIEAEGIDLMKSYEQLTAEEYWKIRNILIAEMPQFRNVRPSPPYEISPKEDQIITTIQSLLQRSVSQDLSPAGKFLILLIWVGSFFSLMLFDEALRDFLRI